MAFGRARIRSIGVAFGEILGRGAPKLIASYFLTTKTFQEYSLSEPGHRQTILIPFPAMILKNLLSIAAIVSGLADKHLKQQIEFLKEQNQVLEEYIHNQCGRKRICLTDNQRRRLAVKAKLVGGKVLGGIGCF